MIYLEFPIAVYKILRKRKNLCVFLVFFLIFLYFSTKYYDSYNLQTNGVSIDDDNSEENYVKIEEKLSVKERMLEHSNYTDVLQVFTIVPEIKKRIEKVVQTNTKRRKVGASRKQNRTDSTPTANSQLTNFVCFIAVFYLVVNTIIEAIHNYKNQNEKFDEYGNRVDGLARKYSLADYASMRHSKKNTEFVPSRNKRAFSGASKKPLTRFDSLGTTNQTFYVNSRRESLNSGYGTYANGYDSPVIPTSPVTVVTQSKLLGERPPTLTRRSSFPAGSLSDAYGLYGQGSGDSGDSSPETSRRRVRMIRRH